jgi:hypothetical protein
MRVRARPKVFISHSTSGDAAAVALVGRLRDRLRDWGVDPWFDAERLQTGQVWNDEIRLAIERSDAAVLVVTARYLRDGAHYARDEALLFAQRAATEPFDDFRMFVLLAPDVTAERISRDPDWSNLEIARRQVRMLGSLESDQLDALRPDIDALVNRYCAGAIPLVLREFYAGQLAERAFAAVLEQAAAALDGALSGPAATPRRFVNLLLGAIPAVKRTRDAVERCLHPWRGVLEDRLRQEPGWDAVAFSWLDDDTAQRIASVTSTVGTADRAVLVLTTRKDDTVRLHLRRARKFVAPFEQTGTHPGPTTREDVIRAICDEIRAKRARRERRDPLTIPADQLDDLARTFNELAGSVNPLVVILGPDVYSDDLLDGLAELFNNLILVVLADESQVDRLSVKRVVLRPQEEDEVLRWLDRLIG